ncbi:MAG: hypothetical protein ACPLPR_09025, partial [Bacillota bacterium]
CGRGLYETIISKTVWNLRLNRCFSTAFDAAWAERNVGNGLDEVLGYISGRKGEMYVRLELQEPKQNAIRASGFAPGSTRVASELRKAVEALPDTFAVSQVLQWQQLMDAASKLRVVARMIVAVAPVGMAVVAAFVVLAWESAGRGGAWFEVACGWLAAWRRPR